MGLSPRAEELLSYFTGLAPVGETFEVPMAWLSEDIGINNKTAYHQYLNQLQTIGAVRRVACGAQRSTGVLVVVRRLEEMHRDEA